MKKVMLLAILLLLPLVAAESTVIKIKTFPNRDVQIAAIKSEGSSSEVIQIFKGKSDDYGDLEFTLTSDVKEFYINSFVYRNGETIFKKMFDESFASGKEVSLTLAPDGTPLRQTPGTENLATTPTSDVLEIETNSTPSNETNSSLAAPLQEEEVIIQNTPSPTTGNVISNTLDSTMPLSYLYYVLGALMLAGVLFFVFKSRGSAPHNQFKPASRREAAYVMQLEHKLKNAQHEINVMKNQEKIKQAEHRVEEDKKELDRLRRGF